MENFTVMDEIFNKTDQTLDLVKPGCMFTVATESGLEFIKVLMCIKLTGSNISRTDYFKHIEKNGFVVAEILLKDPDNPISDVWNKFYTP